MRLSVKIAVTLVAALLFGISLLLSGLAWRAMENANAAMNTLMVDRIEPLEDLSIIHTLLQANTQDFLTAALQEQDEKHRVQVPELIQRFEKNRAEIDRRLARYGNNHTTEEETRLAARFSLLRGHWLNGVQPLLQQVAQTGVIEHRLVDDVMSVRTRFGIPTLEALDDLIRLQVHKGRQETAWAQAEYAASKQKAMWLLIGTLLSGILALAAIARSINRPISAFQRMLSDFAAGRTNARIGEYKGYLAEFEQLGQEVNAMADAVVDQQSQMAATLASMDTGVMQIEHGGRILRINDAMARMTGAQASDLIGHSLSTLFAKGIGPTHMGEFVSRSHRRFDWLSRRSPGQFRQVLEAAPLGVLRIDAAGIIRLANPAAAHWLAGAADQIEGRRIGDFILFEDGASFAGTLARGVSDLVLPVLCLNGQRRKTLLGLQPMANGEALFWMMDAAHTTWSTLNDSAFGCFLVEEKEEEVLAHLLAGMGRKLDRLALHSPDVLLGMLNDAPLACIQVGPDGIIRYANAQAHQLAGFAPGILAGMPLSLLIPQAARDGHDAQVRAFQSAPNTRRMGEGRALRMATQSGREIEVEVGLINHETADGRMTFALLRSEMDLPWSVISSTTFGRTFAEEEEEEEEAMLWLRSAKGRSLPVQVSVGVVREGPHAGQMAVVNVTDISLLTQKTQEIETQRDLLARVQHAMHDGLVLIDRHGNITEANPRALDIMGCSLTQALERRIGHFFEEEEEEEEEEVMRWMPSLHGTGLQRLYAADPYRFWIYLWEMKKPLVVFGDGCQVSFANPAAELVLNADRGSLLGCTHQEMIDEGNQSVMSDLLYAKMHHDSSSDTDLPGFIWKAGDALLSQKVKLCPVQTLMAPMVVCCMGGDDLSMEEAAMMTRSDDERHIARADGSKTLVALSGAPLRDAQGHITGAVITIKDISELSAMKEREKLLAQTANQAKMATLGEMATGVMHEVNQPLTYISSVVQTLKRSRKKGVPLPDDKIAEMLDESLRQIDRIGKIMNHLRVFGRADAAEGTTAVYWPSVLDDALILIGKKLSHANITLKLEIAESLSQVLGNANGFEQILINFFQNAMHALDGRGNGEIRLSMSVETGGEKDWVKVRFSDNGTGMPPEVRDKCFEPFFTTKPAGVGTGIGLSLVHGIVLKHGGMITVDSEPGAGTTFTMRFPALDM